MAMDIKSLALPPQTEEQKKQQREKITKLMLNPTQEAEKTLIGASNCQHLFKYVSPIEKELELQREEREKQNQLFKQSLEYQQRQRENHKQMRIDEQVEAMRKFEAEKQQVNIDAGTGKVNAKSDTQRTRTTNLKRAINQAVKDIGHKPSFEVLWRYFHDDKDKSGFIEDYTDTHLIWRDTKGKMHDTEKETIRNHLSAIKS